MKRYTFVLSLLLLATSIHAQEWPKGIDPKFPAATINPLLALEADAVIRLDQDEFDIASIKKATHRVRQVTTILSADGRDEGRLQIHYSKLISLRKVEGRIRDAEGNVIRKLKKEDMQDYSATWGTLYRDSRVRIAELYHHTYPYTVEFEYELTLNGLLNWPAWYPQRSGIGVEYSTFEIRAPEDVNVRYAAYNTTYEPTITSAGGGKKTYRWEATMLPPFMPEPWGPSWDDQVPVVLTAPEAFSIEGYAGNMASWKSFGQWYYNLALNRDVLPQEAHQDVLARVDTISNVREKVRVLYTYLQDRTRYILVQLGIGGWQPYDAAYVHERGYGDCKALTNYMDALLRAAGIEAYPALIQRGFSNETSQVRADFPSNQFNHVILMVPTEQDTLWLENTSQTIPFGHIGADNEDRYALVVKREGGELVRTPKSTADQSQQVRTATVDLTAGGHATIRMETSYSGNQQDFVRLPLVSASGQERLEWLREVLDLPNVDITGADFSSVEAGADVITLPVNLKVSRYAVKAGKRLFLAPNLMGRWTSVPPERERERTQPITRNFAFLDTDTIDYVLPEGYTVEAMPAPIELETPYGRYQARSILNQEAGTLSYQRMFELSAAEVPAEDYDLYRDFLQQVARADKAQMVLVGR